MRPSSDGTRPTPLQPTPLRPTLSQRRTSSLGAAVGLLTLLLLLLPGIMLTALAQIRPAKPAHIRADTRRAQRQGRHSIDLPYRDTHLDRPHLKRGEGDQPRPEGADAYYYKKGKSPSETDRNLWGLRRKKTKPKE